MAVTIRDIAADLGISHATVSRVLSGRGADLISAATSKRVVEAAERLGYRRNHHARALQTGRSDAIGCLHTGPFSGWHGFWGRLVSGIAESAREGGFDLVLIPCPGGVEAVRSGVRHVQERRVDALVVTGALFLGGAEAELLESGAPVVIAQPIIQVPSAMPAVSLDPRPGMAAAAAHLAALGHRAITWLDVPAGSRDEARRVALREAAHAHGLAWEAVEIDGPWDGLDAPGRGRCGYRSGLRLLAERPGVTAICCYNEALATGVCAAAAERGLRVPRDLSVIGFDDHQAESAVPALTTVSHMLEAIGQQAGDLARAALDAGGRTVELRRTVPASLVVRDSTGPAPQR